MLKPWATVYTELHWTVEQRWKRATIPFSEFFQHEIKKYELVHDALINENLRITFSKNLAYPSWVEYLPDSWKTVASVVMTIRCSRVFGVNDTASGSVFITSSWDIVLTKPEEFRLYDALENGNPITNYWVQYIRDRIFLPFRAG